MEPKVHGSLCNFVQIKNHNFSAETTGLKDFFLRAGTCSARVSCRVKGS